MEGTGRRGNKWICKFKFKESTNIIIRCKLILCFIYARIYTILCPVSNSVQVFLQVNSFSTDTTISTRLIIIIIHSFIHVWSIAKFHITKPNGTSKEIIHRPTKPINQPSKPFYIRIKLKEFSRYSNSIHNIIINAIV